MAYIEAEECCGVVLDREQGYIVATQYEFVARTEDRFALQFDTAVIATGDPEDIRRLAAPFSRVGVFAL